MTEPLKFIRWNVARNRVGSAIFGEDYVSRIAWKEYWLLSATGMLGFDDVLASEGQFGKYQAGKGPFANHPELLAARSKQAFMYWQRLRIAKWFDRHKIAVHKRDSFDEVEQRDFEPAFLRSFPPHIDGQEDPGESDPEGMRRGRPREWDWDGAYIEIIRIAQMPDGLPDVQARLVESIAEWFMRTVGDQPAESKVKERVSAVYQALERGPK
jgi:predicted DNA-binding transcriptional regulator AlpA